MARSVLNIGSQIRERPVRPLHLDSPGDPDSPYGILLSRLHTLGLGPGGPLRTIGMTSSLRGEGVTTVACNLAMYASSGQGLRVLLVDANFAHPNLHQIFHLSNAPGLSEMLTGTVSPSDCIHDMSALPVESWPTKLRKSLRRSKRQSRNRDDIPSPQLSVITLGARVPRGGDIGLENENILDNASALFDLVIVDLPAENSAANYGFPLSILDGLLFVLKAEATSDIAAQKSLRRLKENGANVMGAVFNQCRTHLPRWIDKKLGD